MKISPHFSRKEFTCKCKYGCRMDAVDVELLTALEDVRCYFNKPLMITSGDRCVLHNRDIYGHPRSYHLISMAADFKVLTVEAWEVQRYLRGKYPDKYGIGMGENFTHLDVRSDKARWFY